MYRDQTLLLIIPIKFYLIIGPMTSNSNLNCVDRYMIVIHSHLPQNLYNTTTYEKP